jgi:hypothetical protein
MKFRILLVAILATAFSVPCEARTILFPQLRERVQSFNLHRRHILPWRATATVAPTVTAAPVAVEAIEVLDASDDAAFSRAMDEGLHGRSVLGFFRGVNAIARQYIADLKGGKSNAVDTFKAAQVAELTRLGRTPNPQRQCTIATWAVIGIEMAEAFGANIPNYAQLLAIAQALQAQMCGTVPPTPVPVPVPVPVPAKAK